MENKRKHGLKQTLDSKKTKILILGTFPAEETLVSGEYYSNSSNRFWDVIFSVIKENKPEGYEDKIKILNKHSICLWDLIESCERVGSLDKDIHNAIKNDFSSFNNAKIFVNGFSPRKKYKKYGLKESDLDGFILLPSTSRANASYNLKKLIKEWESNIIND